MRPSDPRRLELGPEGHDQYHAKGRDPVYDPTKQEMTKSVLEAGGEEEAQRTVSAVPSTAVAVTPTSSLSLSSGTPTTVRTPPSSTASTIIG